MGIARGSRMSAGPQQTAAFLFEEAIDERGPSGLSSSRSTSLANPNGRKSR